MFNTKAVIKMSYETVVHAKMIKLKKNNTKGKVYLSKQQRTNKKKKEKRGKRRKKGFSKWKP